MMPGTHAGKPRMALVIVLQKTSPLMYSSLLGKRSIAGRSEISVKETKQAIKIEISSKDATALRASANSVLRTIQVAEAASKI